MTTTPQVIVIGAIMFGTGFAVGLRAPATRPVAPPAPFSKPAVFTDPQYGNVCYIVEHGMATIEGSSSAISCVHVPMSESPARKVQ